VPRENREDQTGMRSATLPADRVGRGPSAVRPSLRRALGLACLLRLIFHPVPLSAQAPDAVVLAERVYTADSTAPVVEAIAIREGRIVSAGSRQAVMAAKGPARRGAWIFGRGWDQTR
jgi:hypothetical protein